MTLAHFRLALALAALLGCSSARHTQLHQSAPEDAIRNARLAQNAAIAERKADSVASFWTEDVTVTAGLGVVVRGREAYKTAFRLDTPILYTRTPETIVVSQHWPLGWEEGTWTGIRSEGENSQSIGGRYAAQWVHHEGRWQIRSELFVALNCTGRACDFPVRLR